MGVDTIIAYRKTALKAIKEAISANTRPTTVILQHFCYQQVCMSQSGFHPATEFFGESEWVYVWHIKVRRALRYGVRK